MRNIVWSNLCIFLIFSLNLKLTLSVPLGLVNIIKQEQKLDETDYLKIVEDLQNPKNESKMTIFGWLKIENIKKRNDLFQILNIDKENIQNDENLQNNLLKASYFKDDHKSFIDITWLNSQNTFNNITENIILPSKKWFFFSYSFNYEIKKHILTIITFSEVKKVHNIEFMSDYVDFQIEKKFEINIGCFPLLLKSQKLEERNCLDGHLKHLSYIFEFFERGENLYFLNQGHNQKMDFIFDFYKKNEIEQNFSSKDKTETKIILQGKKNFDKKTNLLISKGENSFLINKSLTFIKKNELVNVLSFHFAFKYEEFLPTRFEFFTLNLNENIIVESFLDLQGFNRNFYISIPEYDIEFKTGYLFENEKVNIFDISFVQENDFFYLIFKSGHIFKKSKKFKKIINLEKSELYLLKKNHPYSGNFKIYKTSISDNIRGLIFEESSSDYTNLEKYYPKCKIFENIENTHIKCSVCKSDYLLNEENECINYCSKGKKNIGNICMDCEKKNCPELDQNYFIVTREKFNVFSIKLIKDIYNLKNDLKDIFWISFSKFPTEFDINYQVKEDEFNGTILYVFDFNKNINIDPGVLAFSLKTDITLVDENKNIIQNQVFEFPLKNTNYKIAPYHGTRLVLEKINDDIELRDLESERKQKLLEKYFNNEKEARRKNIKLSLEHNIYTILGFISSILTILLFIVSFIGSLINTENLDDDTFFGFFFQKSIQSFLISKQFAFWLFYSYSLTDNLKNFLSIFYKYTISVHSFDLNDHNKIFNNDKITIWQQMGIIIIFHIILISIYLFFKIIYLLTKKISSNYKFIGYSTHKRMLVTKSKKVSKIVLFHFEFKFLITYILIFSIEYIFFLFHQLKVNKNMLENTIATVMIVIILFLIGLITIFPLKKVTRLWNTGNLEKFGFIYNGIELRGMSKMFQGIQYIYSVLFSVIIMTFNERPTLAISMNFVITVLFALFIIFKRPANHDYWKKEQIFTAFLLVLSKIILLIVVFNNKGQFLGEKLENYLGGMLCILIFMILLWNLLVLLYKIGECVKKLKNIDETMILSKSSDYSLSPTGIKNRVKINDNIFSNQLKKKRSFDKIETNYLEDKNLLSDKKISNENKMQMKSSRKSTPTSNSSTRKKNTGKSSSKSRLFLKSLSSLFDEDAEKKLDKKMFEITEENKEKFIELEKKGSISKHIKTRRSAKEKEVFNEKLDVVDIDFFTDKKSIFNCSLNKNSQIGKLRDLAEKEDKTIIDMNSESSSRKIEDKNKREIIKDISATSGFIESSDQTIEQEDDEDKKNKGKPISLFSNTNNDKIYHYEKF